MPARRTDWKETADIYRRLRAGRLEVSIAPGPLEPIENLIFLRDGLLAEVADEQGQPVVRDAARRELAAMKVPLRNWRSPRALGEFFLRERHIRLVEGHRRIRQLLLDHHERGVRMSNAVWRARARIVQSFLLDEVNEEKFFRAFTSRRVEDVLRGLSSDRERGPHFAAAEVIDYAGGPSRRTIERARQRLGLEFEIPQ